jgi:hypothetical protein
LKLCIFYFELYFIVFFFFRQPFNFLTDKVVEMTCQCLMAQAEEAERNMFDDETSEKLIIEEFGRCLKEIIESAHKAEAT